MADIDIVLFASPRTTSPRSFDWLCSERSADHCSDHCKGIHPIGKTFIAGSESVQTPREVYDELKKEGYRVQYYRLPLTDGEAPKETIFDVFYSHVKVVPPSDAPIFNCQMGGGRTTTGMVIGCLIRMHTSGTCYCFQHCR